MGTILRAGDPREPSTVPDRSRLSRKGPLGHRCDCSTGLAHVGEGAIRIAAMDIDSSHGIPQDCQHEAGSPRVEHRSAETVICLESTHV